MKEINIAELLKDCPKGMELDSPLYDNLVFCKIDSETRNYTIITQLPNGEQKWFTSHGRYDLNPNAKCVIFPKGKTTWEGFVPPCKFKDGDIVYTRSDEDEHINYIFIFESITENTHVNSYLHIKDGYDLRMSKVWLTNCDDKYLRFATEEEKQRLFDAIKANGYHWNAETKTLEKLVHNKFDITTLKPFESKVLVRDKNSEKWIGHFFSHYENSDKPYVCIGVEGLSEYKQCIPYEGNEHLLDSSEECDDYYKNWN